MTPVEDSQIDQKRSKDLQYIAKFRYFGLKKEDFNWRNISIRDARNQVFNDLKHENRHYY